MPTKKQHNRYGWYVVLISALIGVSMTASFPQFTMVVEEYAVRLQTTKEFLLFTDTVRSISIMGGMLLSGPVYQKLGLKRTFVFAIASMVVPQILFPFVTRIWIVMVLKIVQGLCAVIFPVFLITIMEWVDRGNIGTATAVFNGIFYGGSGIGATAAGLTISSLGWKASFYMIGLLTLIPSILWFFTVKEKDNFPDSPTHEETSISSEEKVFVTVIRSFKTWALVICLFSTIWMVQVLSVDLPLYGGFYNYSADSVGLMMSSLSFGIFFACVVSGKISDYFAGRSKNPGTARLSVFAFGPLITIAIILVLLVIDKGNFPIFYSVILLLSFASAWGLGSFYCILPELMEKKSVEYATGFIGGIADLAMPIGPFIFGIVFGVKGLWTAAWISCIVICGISLAGAGVLKSKVRIKRIKSTD